MLPLTNRRMAHALSIVGEAGLEGFNYDSAVNSISRAYEYKSRKCRWMLANSPVFTPMEFLHFMAYAAKNGFVDAGKNQERLMRGELSEKTWLLTLTLLGWDHIEKYDRTLLGQWLENLKTNWPTVVVSVAGA